MIQEWVLFSLALVSAVSGGFLFAMAETCFSSLRRWQVRSIIAHPKSDGLHFEKFLASREKVLAVFVLGNALSTGIFILCGLWLLLRLEWSPEWLFLGLFLFILFVTEVLPKSLVVANPAQWAIRLQQFYIWSNRFFGPLASFLLLINQKVFLTRLPKSVKSQQSVNDNDVQQLLEIASQKGAIGVGEREIIKEIISLDHQTAGDIMNPRLELDGIEITDSPDEMVESARKHRHRRLILFRQNKEHIVGFLNTRNFLLTGNLESAFEVPSYVPDSMNLLTLFVSLQKQKRGIAVVLDEFGTPAGIITMEDILEEVVGNIQSEGRPDEQLIKQISPGRWLVKGNARIEDFQTQFAPMKGNDDVDTLAGLFLISHQVIPNLGDSVQHGNYTFVVTQVDEKRILEMEISSNRKPGTSPLNRLTRTHAS